MNMGSDLSFFRVYHVDLRSSVGRVVAVRLRLGVRGGVDGESGMVLNLSLFDRAARGLVQRLEGMRFSRFSDCLDWILREWQLVAQKYGVKAEAVELRGRFGCLRGEVVNSVLVCSWTLRRLAVDPLTKATGALFVRAHTRRQALLALRELRALQSFSSESLLAYLQQTDTEKSSGLIEIGFRARKKAAQNSIRWTANPL